MWRWPVVRARKDAVNNLKGKVFSLHAKLITLAAQKWSNPDDNSSLANAIYEAKKAWVPNDNILRSIKKWSGEDQNDHQIQEVIYEGYANWWIAVLVHCLTDNKNRTVANIRHIFSKYGGSLWESGSVSWIFKKKWIIYIDANTYNYDDIEILALETDVQDISLECWYIKIITHVEDFNDVVKYIKSKSIDIYESKIDYLATHEVEVNDHDQVLKFTKMLHAFDEDEDVNYISSNEIITPELQEKVDTYIEKHNFHT